MNIIEQIYYDMVEDETETDRAYPKSEEKNLCGNLEKLLKENNITGDKYNAFWDVVYDLMSFCKCDGFKSGFKMGVKCMLEVINDE